MHFSLCKKRKLRLAIKNTGKEIAWAIGWEIACWIGVPFFVVGCFFVFDQLHITQLEPQIALAVSPLVLLAFFMLRRDRRKAREVATVESSIGDGERHRESGR